MAIELAADCLDGDVTDELTAYSSKSDAMSTLPDNDGLKRLGLRCIFIRRLKMIIELCNLSNPKHIDEMILKLTTRTCLFRNSVSMVSC